MLKKSEGLVTLTVCNPNKAKAGDDPNKKDDTADAATIAPIDAKSNSITSHRSDVKVKGSVGLL